MARYIANKDIDWTNPPFKKGDEVDVNQIPSGAFGHFDLIRNNAPAPREEVTGEPTEVVNLDRDQLKARADELELKYPANISTVKLAELVAAAEA